MDALNREFQRLLVSSGWSQSRAASELRLDAATISRYMSGTISPSETVLRLFGEILGERVVLGSDIIPPSMKTGPRHVEVYEGQALDALRKLPPKARRQLCDLILTMASVVEDASIHRPSEAPFVPAAGRGQMLSPREANLIRHMRGQATPEAEPPADATEPVPAAPAPRVPRRRLPVR